jgi:hypothetical protein
LIGMDPRSALLVPAVLLAAAGVWLTNAALIARWLTATGKPPASASCLVLAVALHLAWLLPATFRRNPTLVAVAWGVTLTTCRNGLLALGVESALGPALLLEGLPLALALAAALGAAPGLSWCDRLTEWRRAQQAITTQLRMSEGLLPWLRASLRRLLFNRPDRPAASFDRAMADLADADHRLQLRVSQLAMPDELKAVVQCAAQALVACAEARAAETTIALEQQALEAAAACRDRVAAWPGLSPRQADALGHACERLLLDLAATAVPHVVPQRPRPLDRKPA